MGKFRDLTGQKFNRLTVLNRADNRRTPCGSIKVVWNCVCDCNPNKIIKVDASSLIKGSTKSCGCYKNNKITQYNKTVKKKYNKYNMSNDYGIGWTTSGYKFIFDKDDYEKIKDYCWYINGDGHLVTKKSGEKSCTFIHRLILNLIDDTVIVDHINKNPLDNRKSNLRITNNSGNAMNKSLQHNNKSGIAGVYFDKKYNRWIARININKKQTSVYSGTSFEDAVKARLEAEVKYYGEFAPQQHLYEQYGIDTTIR